MRGGVELKACGKGRERSELSEGREWSEGVE